MNKFLTLLIAFCFLWPHASHATPLVADLSTYRIDIDSSFSGTRIFLFGARNDNGDVVVVIRGPHKNYMVRRKEEVGGLWINKDRMKFYHMPDYYAVATSRPLTDMEQSALFNQLGIGEYTLFSRPANMAAYPDYDKFASAFLQHQHARRLYTNDFVAVQFMGETLFKTVVQFPDNIPAGDYTAEIYLIGDGEVVGMQSTPIKVVKSGVDAFLSNYAHEWPALYGITAIVLALSCGWFAGRLFEKV